MGDATAHFNLSCLYRDGKGVERDVKKEIYHLEKASIAGHPKARVNLALCEVDNERYDRAVKHLIIASNLGDDKAIELLKKVYREGVVSKDNFEAALRAHYAAVNEMKSKQRKEAAEKQRGAL